MNSFWDSIPAVDALRGEGNVEHRLVLPLLRALGYEPYEIESKYPVVFQEGRLGRKPEADFVCFYGPLRDRSNSLLVVEAKQPGEKLPPGKAQGESYAQNLRAPLLLLINGEVLEIWQMQITQESQCVLSIPVTSLVSERGNVERLLNKTAVRDYCKSLSFKTMAETTADFGGYEAAELRRMSSNRLSIARTLRRAETTVQLATLETTHLLSEFSSGAIVIAPSGYGKTTLSHDLFKRAIEDRCRGKCNSLPFDVPLPDLEQSGVSLMAFIQQRLSAHNPGVTPAFFLTIVREIGVTVCCDAFDRTTVGFQKKLTTEFASLLRDYPRAQLFIFSRTALNVRLPSLELEALSSEQVRELETVILGDGSAPTFSIVGMMSRTLRSLCVNPLLLRLTLDYWKREQGFPRKIEFLFRSWLDSILECDPTDAVSKVQREQALTALAKATVAGPIASADAIAQLEDRGIPAAVLNELIQCNAVRMTGAVVELVHEGLADYLRAKAFAAMSETDLFREIPTLSVSSDSFFPVLAMAQLPSRGLQSALWKRLSVGRIGVYLDALRYRFDVSNELRQLDSERLSLNYLDDLIDGIEIPLAGFFPEMHASAMEWLTGVSEAALAATGRARADPGSLDFKLHAKESGEPRVIVATPELPGTIRGVNLDTVSTARASSE